ncbi:MAG: SIMPL domain-containing protein [Rickettsiales bacterium]|nr:SIMPL domain-containing protein [Rickettsiales bacterium]
MKKKFVRIIDVIGVAAILTLLLTYSEKPSDPRVVTVTGECLTAAPKDRTAITLRIKTLNDSAAVSMKLASLKMAEITTYLKTLDVRLQTTQFDSYEKTEWDRNAQKSVTLGMETNIAVEVSAKDMDTIEKVLTQFAGQQNVYSENLHMFTSAETLKPIMEKCLGEAVANARERAAAIAAGDNRKVGKMISAEYGNSISSPIRPTNFLRSATMEMASDKGYAGGGLVSKDTEVSVSVSAMFEVR